MKKRPAKAFDSEYTEFIEPGKSHARYLADLWRLYFECFPVTRGINHSLLEQIEAEIRKAVETGDANFFRRFAKYIESPKEPCAISKWIYEVHFSNVNGPDTRFTHAELVEGAKQAGFFKGMDDDSILTQLKRKMKRLNIPFKNSPQK